MEPELQALPVDTATGSMFTTTASASAPSKRIFVVFGSLRVTSPISETPVNLNFNAAVRRSRNSAVRADSDDRSSAAIRAAAPKPAMPATFSDPIAAPVRARHRE